MGLSSAGLCIVATAQRPSPERVEDTPGATQRATYEGQGILHSWALGLWDKGGPTQTPQAEVREAAMATRGDRPHFPTLPQGLFPGLCQVLCTPYPPQSQNSNLSPGGGPLGWDLSAGPLTLGSL